MENISSSLPEKPWVYLFKKWKKFLYIWKAKNLKNRVSSYFRKWIWVWKEDMVAKADNFEYLLTLSEEEALILEEKLVKKHNPFYNCILKWDNAYTYILITDEEFPKIEFTRFKDKKWIYIWPKPWKKDLKNTLQVLRQIFKFRTCSQTQFKQWKLCSDFTLGLCQWYCIFNKKNNNYDISYYQVLKKEYAENIKIIKDFFNWKIYKVKDLIKDNINDAVKKENFEYANILKNIYYKIDKLTEKQSIELNEKISWYFIRIKKLKNIYFMIYARFQDGKLIDIVKLKDNENNFLGNMLKDNLISNYKKLDQNFYFWK